MAAANRRLWILLIIAAVIVGPMAGFSYLNYRNPARTAAIVLAIFDRLPAGLRDRQVSWQAVGAYMKSQVPRRQPVEARRELAGKNGGRPSFLVVAIGDSQTAGHLASPVDRWTFHLQQMMQYRLRKTVRVINAGIPGEIATLGLGRLERDVIALEPDLAIVGYLFNDGRIFGLGPDGSARTLVDFESFVADVREIVNKLHKAEIPVLVWTCCSSLPTFFGPDRQHWGVMQEMAFVGRVNALRELAEKHNVPLVDTFSVISAMPDKVKIFEVDGVHLNAKGHKMVASMLFEKWAEKILPQLADELQS